MGFYPQSNKWQCGPFALKHALAINGRFVDERTVTRIAKSTRSGTDEKMLRKAAIAFDSDLKEIRRHDEHSAYKALTAALAKGLPCLICINQWGHWVTIVGFEQKTKKFVVIDSEKNPVVRITSWSKLKHRWVFIDERSAERKEYYDLYILKNGSRVQTKADFSILRARRLRLKSNAAFVAHFDEYVTDMLYIARPRSSRGAAGSLSMAEFLRRHKQMLMETVQHWHGSVTTAQLNRVLRNMQFVAETYGLVIRHPDERRAIASLASLLSTWATTHAPIGALYGKKI